MLTPLNEILQELVSDFGISCGEDWRYVYRDGLLGPREGLYIDICEEFITIHGRLDNDEVIFSDTYRRQRQEPSIDYDILLSGFIYFYRVIGQYMDIDTNLATYSVKMTERFVRMLSNSENEDKLITLSFKDGKSWIDVSHLI